jgi:hypothetical protein
MNNNKSFTPPQPLKTPVLFLIYKRLDTTKQVFEAIRKAKPPRLYIAGDGPRDDKSGETENVMAVREYVLNNIDWECEVKTLFRDKNLGCGRAVSQAITWFFGNEEQGIILEDDTLPSLSFFWFCEELLKRYKDDMRIWHIGGCNFQNGIKRGDGDYYFSALNHVWGWASWADRWKYYDFEMKSISDDSFLEYYWKGRELKYWKDIFWKMKKLEIDTWDYQWTFCIWYLRGLSIIPQKNLVKNIGFGPEATHTKADPNFKMDLEEIEFPLKHPDYVKRCEEADIYSMKKLFLQPVWKVFISKILPAGIKGVVKRYI